MAKQSITIYADKLAFLDAMSDTQVAALFRAIKAHQCGDDVEQFLGDDVVRFTFVQFKRDFDRDESRHTAIAEIRRKVGRLGGQATACKRKQNQAKGSKTKQKVAKGSKCQQMLPIATNCQQMPPIATNCLQPTKNQEDTGQKNDKNSEKAQNSCNSSDSVVDNNIILNNNQSKRERSDIIPFPETPKPKKRRKAAEADHDPPPTLQEVMAVFRTAAAQLPTWEDEARIFFYHYDGLGWRNTHGVKIRNWDSFANKWIFDKINENKRKLSRQGDKRATTGIEPECGLIEP